MRTGKQEETQADMEEIGGARGEHLDWNKGKVKTLGTDRQHCPCLVSAACV